MKPIDQLKGTTYPKKDVKLMVEQNVLMQRMIKELGVTLNPLQMVYVYQKWVKKIWDYASFNARLDCAEMVNKINDSKFSTPKAISRMIKNSASKIRKDQ